MSKPSNKEAYPFVKWAGGKRQLLIQLKQHLPEILNRGNFTYIEPFVGGGAMLFYMLQNFPNIKRVFINDINSYLITAYRTIKNEPDELIERLSVLERQYFSLENEEMRKTFFLGAREIFNEERLDDIDRTTFLIFLNRTCFNGLYRVNAKGKFNVPFGKYLHPTICNEAVIKADSELLNQADVIIMDGDFEGTFDCIDKDGTTFFYLDPPYRPLSATSSFNSYAKEEFDDGEQIRLRNFCQMLDSQLGTYWMLSNSDCSAIDPNDRFFETIYKDFFFSRVYASRSINAVPTKRGKLSELLISNYPPEEYGIRVAEDVEFYNQAI